MRNKDNQAMQIYSVEVFLLFAFRIDLIILAFLIVTLNMYPHTLKQKSTLMTFLNFWN